MKTKVTERLEHVDIVKGIGIFAVVLGHCTPHGFLNDFIYMFHMPLFFFISGYLYQQKHDERIFIRKKLRQFMIPYSIYLTLVTILQIYKTYTMGTVQHTVKPIIQLLAGAVLGGRWLAGYAAAFWFIPVLLMTIILTNYIIIRVSQKKVIILMSIFLVLSYLNSLLFQKIKVPLNLNTLLISCPIFYLGYMFRSSNLTNYKFLYYTTAIAGAILTLYEILPPFDMKNSMYGAPVVSILFSVSITIILIDIGKLLIFSNVGLSKYVAYMGQASLIIMYLHQPTQILIRDNYTKNGIIRIAISILLSLVIFFLARKNQTSTLLLIGTLTDMKKAQDFNKI